MIPCVIFEDEHLLVVNKPAGWNTHAPSPYAVEGIYDWLRHREPRWNALAIIHRLDKETSGLLMFGKTPLANRSLTQQFTERQVKKRYVLVTDRKPQQSSWTVKSRIRRIGSRYQSGNSGDWAETQFKVLDAAAMDGWDEFNLLQHDAKAAPCHFTEAIPLTGRTHQIRVHAAEIGIPVLGDSLYDGTRAARLFLHARSLTFEHPETGHPLSFNSPPHFGKDSRQLLRTAVIDPEMTNAHRVIHGAPDGWPGWYVDQLGNYLLSQSEAELDKTQRVELNRIATERHALGVYHKQLSRRVRQKSPEEASPRLITGNAAPESFTVMENGLRYELSFNEGYSVGLFLDQRDNRQRLLSRHVAANFQLRESSSTNHTPEILNVFSYTCAFSVCAAKAGARVTSLDLSRKYLDWGRRNFELNKLDPTQHDFIYGDAFDWLKRLAKKDRKFDLIILDPPTFSQSKQSGVFRVGKDYGKLVKAAMPLLNPEGVLFASTNAADWAPEEFLETVRKAVGEAQRNIKQEQYFPQPPDFPVNRAEPAYLKTIWLEIS